MEWSTDYQGNEEEEEKDSVEDFAHQRRNHDAQQLRRTSEHRRKQYRHGHHDREHWREANKGAIGKGRISIDSGAAGSVILKDMLKECVTIEDSKMKDTIYTSADVALWLQAAPLSISRSGRCEHGGVPVYHSDKPLASVARIAFKGNRVVFKEDAGYIENEKSGNQIATIKDRGTYAIEVEYMISHTSEEDNELGSPGSGRWSSSSLTSIIEARKSGGMFSWRTGENQTEDLNDLEEEQT